MGKLSIGVGKPGGAIAFTIKTYFRILYSISIFKPFLFLDNFIGNMVSFYVFSFFLVCLNVDVLTTQKNVESNQQSD